MAEVGPREPDEAEEHVGEVRPAGRDGEGERRGALPAGDAADARTGEFSDETDPSAPPRLTRAARIRRILRAVLSLLVALGMLALSFVFLE